MGLRNTGEVEEHNGNPLWSIKVQIVVEEYQKLKEVKKTEKVQADSQKWHCKRWKLFWEDFFNSCALRLKAVLLEDTFLEETAVFCCIQLLKLILPFSY